MFQGNKTEPLESKRRRRGYCKKERKHVDGVWINYICMSMTI
jgi:hypothetical protein